MNSNLINETENYLDDFPNKISDLKPVNKVLFSSTGAKLMEHKVTGKKYVLKKGASAGQVRDEYTATKIYNVIGVTVPRMKIYNENTDNATILSEYLENTIAANDILEDVKKEILKGFVADCLLANWDIYKNDNILFNKDDGKLYRVDNGGSLRYSARGRDKSDYFTNEVIELDSMIKHNFALISKITLSEIQYQIKHILKKKKAILNLIKDKDLKLKMSKRLFDLKIRLDVEKKLINK